LYIVKYLLDFQSYLVVSLACTHEYLISVKLTANQVKITLCATKIPVVVHEIFW